MILVKDVKDSHTESNGTFRETKEFLLLESSIKAQYC